MGTRHSLLDLLACPACGSALTVEAATTAGDQIVRGTLRCRCGERSSVIDGVATFIPASASEDVYGRQVRESFSFKWRRLPRFGFNRTGIRDFYDDWFAHKLGLIDRGALATYLAGKRAFLDAGTGLGSKIETFCGSNPTGAAVGMDFSESVLAAHQNVHRWPNAFIVQDDITRLPLRPESFDLIVSTSASTRTTS
jgi:uncharacterized protein YbaR (Trm112 family)